jgi:hypothetical protein
MHSPVLAIVWENWRLTRVEAAQRLAQGLLFPAAVLVGFAAFGSVGNGAARLALFLLAMTYFPVWVSVARLNGGRFLDGYRPGYPFSFLYTRPVRTFVLVAVPMAFNAASAGALYFVSALVLRAAFGYPFPLLPLTAGIAACHIAQWTVQWGTGNKVLQWLGSIAATIPFAILTYWRGHEWPARFDFTIGDYTLIASIAVASFGLAVAGVARQRRGDAVAKGPRTAGSIGLAGLAEWLGDRFRFPRSTSSPLAAQVWFNLRSSGLAVLAIGAAVAILIPLLLVVTTRLDVALSGIFTEPLTRGGAVGVSMLSLPAVLFLGGNAFGIRARQGQTYASVFDATQACGTARLAGIRVLVRSVCLLAALAAVVTSIWTSASVIPFDVLEDNDTFIAKSRNPVSASMRVVQAGVEAMRTHELLALLFVAFIVLVVMVAVRASLTALRARYPRHLNIIRSVLLTHGLVLVLLVMSARRGLASPILADAMLTATKWTAVAALLLATIYFLWTSLAERLLTPRSAAVVLVVWTAFAVAWFTMLRAAAMEAVVRVLAGVQLASVPATDVMWMVLPVLLLPLASTLAVWSLSRARHM